MAIPLALKPTQVREALIRAMLVGLVPLITSSPGVGKSDIVNSIAHTYRMKLIDFRVPQADTTDFNGLPFRNTETNKAEFMPFDLFPLEGDSLPAHPDGGTYEGWIIFMDELTSAPKHLQAPAYKLILDRLVGNRKLHNRVLMCAAGNLSSDKAIVVPMSTALQSRLIHLELKVDLRDWIDWALKNDIDYRIIGFMEFKPEMLHRFTPDNDDKTFACPRTWSFVSKLIKNQPVTMEDLPLLAGAVSLMPAQELISFIDLFTQLPKIKDIINDPENIGIPDEPSIKFALAMMLAKEMNKNNVKELAKFIGRLPIEHRVVCLRAVRQNDPTLIQTQAIQEVFLPIIQRL